MNNQGGVKSIQSGMALIYGYWLWLFFRFIQELLGSQVVIPPLWQILGTQWLIFRLMMVMDKWKVNKIALFGLLFLPSVLETFLLTKNPWQMLGYLIFATVYGVYLSGNYAGERNLFYKFKTGNKMRNISIGLLIVLLWLKDTTNLYALSVSIGLGIVYAFVNTYVLNAYEWYLKWQYLESCLKNEQKDSYVQIDYDIQVAEKLNQKYAWLSVGAALGLGAVLLGVLKGLAELGIFQLAYRAFLWVVTLVATVVLGLLGLDHQGQVTGESQVQSPSKTVEQFVLAGKKTGVADYQGAYQYGTIILIGAILILLGLWVLKRMKQPKIQGKPPSAKVPTPVSFSRPAVERPLSKDQALALKPEKVDYLIRKKYLALLKRLEARGIPVLPGQTPDELKKSLALIYPNQEMLLDLVTEAYCERRYADRDANKMAQALAAFDELKEVKYDQS